MPFCIWLLLLNIHFVSVSHVMVHSGGSLIRVAALQAIVYVGHGAVTYAAYCPWALGCFLI